MWGSDDVIPLPPGTWDRVMSLPWVIQALGVLGIFFVIVQAAPQISGRFQSTIESWTDSRRRTKTASREADVSALSEQVDNIQVVLEETRKELALSRGELRAFRAEARKYQQAHDEVLGTHGAWDQSMIALVVELGGNPTPKPPLWPDRESAPPPMTNT